MAGSNKIFKENEILFRNGDPADAMYLVRKGNLKVFLQKAGAEVTLAELKDGSIVGEMAFFDDKPRSASVKATAPTEVTVITKSDFEKLLKQIPGWFVAMMKSLSGRLRQTNERLQQLDAAASKPGGAAPAAGGAKSAAGGKIRPNQDYPFQYVLRCLQLVMLAYARDGNKDNPKEPMLDIEVPRRLWGDFFGEGDRALFDEILAVTVKMGFIALKGTPKPTTIVFVNRGGIMHFLQFFTELAKKFTPANPYFSKGAISLFDFLVDTAASSGYPAISLNLSEMMQKAAAKGVTDTATWTEGAKELLDKIPELKATQSGGSISIKVILKEHKLSAVYVRNIQLLAEANLA